MNKFILAFMFTSIMFQTYCKGEEIMNNQSEMQEYKAIIDQISEELQDKVIKCYNAQIPPGNKRMSECQA